MVLAKQTGRTKVGSDGSPLDIPSLAHGRVFLPLYLLLFPKKPSFPNILSKLRCEPATSVSPITTQPQHNTALSSHLKCCEGKQRDVSEKHTQEPITASNQPLKVISLSGLSSHLHYFRNNSFPTHILGWRTRECICTFRFQSLMYSLWTTDQDISLWLQTKIFRCKLKQAYFAQKYFFTTVKLH